VVAVTATSKGESRTRVFAKARALFGMSRRRTLVSVPAALLGIVAGPAAPAAAGTPDTWTKAEPMSWLEILGIFGGIPAGLFVLIVLLALAPSLIRQGRRQPGISWWSEPQWFGAQPVPVRTDESARGSQVARARRVGGVSARW